MVVMSVMVVAVTNNFGFDFWVVVGVMLVAVVR